MAWQHESSNVARATYGAAATAWNSHVNAGVDWKSLLALFAGMVLALAVVFVVPIVYRRWSRVSQRIAVQVRAHSPSAVPSSPLAPTAPIFVCLTLFEPNC